MRGGRRATLNVDETIDNACGDTMAAAIHDDNRWGHQRRANIGATHRWPAASWAGTCSDERSRHAAWRRNSS